MNDKGSAYHLSQVKPVRQNDGESEAVITEQWRKVSGVIGVHRICRIVVGEGVGKGVCLITTAGSALVNVIPEYTISTGIRQTDKDHNFLMDYMDDGVDLMPPPKMFYRAADTKEKDIEIPAYMDDLEYEYWK